MRHIICKSCSKAHFSLVPRPHPQKWEKVWQTSSNLCCVDSAVTCHVIRVAHVPLVQLVARAKILVSLHSTINRSSYLTTTSVDLHVYTCTCTWADVQYVTLRKHAVILPKIVCCAPVL